MNSATIYKAFQSKFTSIIVLLIAIIAKLIQQLYFFSTTLDRTAQLIEARNLLSGHGLTINKLAENGITEVYTPVAAWPAGYPVIISGIAGLTHLHILTSAIVFDLLSIFLFLFFSRKLLILAGCKPIIVNLYVLIAGFFIYDFSELPATDLNALGFYLWAVFLALKILKSGGEVNLLIMLLFSFINFLPASVKFLYLPIVFISPAFLCIYGIKSSAKLIKKAGIVSLLITTLLVIGLFTFQWQYAGSSIYLNTASKGFFPANLINYYYIVISSVTNIVFDYSFAGRAGIISFGKYYFIIWWLNVLLTILLILLLIRAIQKLDYKKISLNSHLIIINGIASLCILFELMYLSARYQLHSTQATWTYIQEARYMALIVVFLQHVYFITIFNNWNKIRSILKLTGGVIALLLLIELVHGVYFTYKIATHKASFWGIDNDENVLLSEVRKQIRNLKDEDPNRKVYFMATDPIYSNAANLENAVCFYADTIPARLKHIDNKSIFLMLEDKTVKHYQNPVLLNKKQELIKTMGSYNFYKYGNQ